MQEPRRICITGSTGSGKTTAARLLAQRLNATHIELDALHWEPNWTAAPLEDFRERVGQAIAGEQWVLDGNYRKVRDLIWSRADMIIWLDYPFHVNLIRLLRRTLRRIIRREELWNGNRENWRAIVGRDSIVWWLIKTHWRRRRELPPQFEQYPHLTVLRFRSPEETARWLERHVEDLSPH